MVLLTLVNVLLALVPRAVMAVMHTTMIRASITAYSTAVGPSSAFRKLTTPLRRFWSIGINPLAKSEQRAGGHVPPDGVPGRARGRRSRVGHGAAASGGVA